MVSRMALQVKQGKLIWQGDRPASSIQQVWDFLSAKLRDIRERLYNAQEEFYACAQPQRYLADIYDGLKLLTDHNREVSSVSHLSDLEQLLSAFDDSHTPRYTRAKDLLKVYMDSNRAMLNKLQEMGKTFQKDILEHLQTYCTDYQSLGISDDKFYRMLRMRIVTVKDVLFRFDRMMVALRQNSHPGKFFEDTKFSQEIAIEYNCDTFPILRVLPDLFQKLETACTIAHDWLRSDRVYLDELAKEIAQTRDKIREHENNYHLTKLEYDKIFITLKQKQIRSDDLEENYDSIHKDLSRLDVKRSRIEIEIRAVEKTLEHCEEQLRDLNSVETDLSSPDQQLIQDGKAHSTYRKRIKKDAHAHSVKLFSLRKKMRKIENKIQHRKSLLLEKDRSEIDSQRLSRKLRGVSRKKNKLSDDMQSLALHLDNLEKLLQRRRHPVQEGHAHQRKSHNDDKRSPGRKHHYAGDEPLSAGKSLNVKFHA